MPKLVYKADVAMRATASRRWKWLLLGFPLSGFTGADDDEDEVEGVLHLLRLMCLVSARRFHHLLWHNLKLCLRLHCSRMDDLLCLFGCDCSFLRGNRNFCYGCRGHSLDAPGTFA